MARTKASFLSDANGAVNSRIRVGIDSEQAVLTPTQPGVSSPAADLVRPTGRERPLVNFEREVVSFFVEATELLGVPRSVGAIYGICFASAEPLSFADISLRLSISQGSLSQGLRVLKDVGALKVLGTHERREYFTPDMELRRLAAHFIEHRLEKQLRSGKKRLKALKTAIPTDNAKVAKELNTRLKYLNSWQSKAEALVPLSKIFLRLT